MRLARLDLFRFGRFTDRSFDLPSSKRDLHVVFGPNEAGKTTSLTAIEDLLFGIHRTSPYGFLHSYDVMRIGAVLEDSDKRLEFQRRKGNKDTVLGPDGLPLAGDAGVLAPFLGGADRTFFDRMFNLSHDRLAEGGQAIVQAEDDVGQMLFSAGTGLSDLRQRLTQLEEEADALWGRQKAARRLYSQAETRFDEASKQLRTHSLTAAAWRAARKDFTDAEKAHQETTQQHEAASVELKKLARIRRVHAHVRRKGELEQDIAALGQVAVLAENAAAELTEAEKHEAQAKARLDVLLPQLVQAQQQLEGLTYDEVLVQRADDVVQLHEFRIKVRDGKDDLPKRRAELEDELAELAKGAAAIGWDASTPLELIDRVPARNQTAQVQYLLAKRGELAAVVQKATEDLETAQSALAEMTARLDALGEPSDISRLAAVLNAVRDSGDVASRIRSAQGQLQAASKQHERALQTLKPSLPDDEDIESLPVPAQAAAQTHRDLVRDYAERQRGTKQRLYDARNTLERNRKSLEKRISDEGLVAPGALEEARAHRDNLWELVKLQYVDGTSVPAEEAQAYAAELKDLPASFETAVGEADAVADRRFDKAEAAGSLAELARGMAEQETLIGQLERQEAVLEEEGRQLESAWQAMWSDVPVTPLAPDDMLEWLDKRNDIVAASEREREAQRLLHGLGAEESEARAQITTELTALGVDVAKMQADTFRVVVEQAQAFQRAEELKAKQREELHEGVRTAEADVKRRQRELETAQSNWRAWQEDWATAVAALGLQADADPVAVGSQINVIEEMRDHAGEAKGLRDRRIATIERDIADFEHRVAATVDELAPDLAQTDAEAAVLELERRRDQATELHKQYNQLSETVTARQEQVNALEEGRISSWVAVQPLKDAAGVEDVAALKTAIERSDRMRSLERKVAETIATLSREGDGLAPEILEEECRDIDIDQVRAREEAAESAFNALHQQLQKDVVTLTEARHGFEAIGGDDAAARAAADREEALAAMQDAAERYVQVRASAVLLRWVIDRYRREKQGPLLKRAGELFRVLTLGSFEKLEVAFDERDTLHLTGVRPCGEVVPLPGLSTGTEDQLFLALRIAAVEDYLARAAALPFVADDLFINFDPERSAAGFEVLGQLAERTQVLFYTHHPHLVDVARKTLGADVHVVYLSEAA